MYVGYQRSVVHSVHLNKRESGGKKVAEVGLEAAAVVDNGQGVGGG